jgi:adenine-specific DNA methylase
LQAATAALAACGYRAVREAHHYRVIQSLVYTIDLSPSVVTQFDAFRKKRNIGGYERAGMTSDQEADEMFSLAKNIREKVENWLHRNYPELLAGG